MLYSTIKPFSFDTYLEILDVPEYSRKCSCHENKSWQSPLCAVSRVSVAEFGRILIHAEHQEPMRKESPAYENTYTQPMRTSLGGGIVCA